MYNSEIKKPELPFTVSSVFFIIITMVKIFSSYILPVAYYGESYSLSVESTIYMVVTFTLAIFLIIKKIFIANTVLIGILAALETYWLIIDASYYEFTYLLANMLCTAAWLLIFVVSIGATTKNTFKGIGKIWFVPVLLYFTAFPILVLNNLRSISYYIEDMDHFDDAAYWLLQVVFALLIQILFAIAFTLLCKWYGRVIGDQREALEHSTQVGYIETAYSQPIYAEPAQPVYAEPAQPVYAQPVQPVYAEPYYQQSVTPPPAEENLAAELEKYKDLFERGLISQAEYDAKKAQLLNL